jgi:hypothetical protein
VPIVVTLMVVRFGVVAVLVATAELSGHVAA